MAPVPIPKDVEGVPLLVTVTAVKMGKSVAFYEATLTDEKNRLIARATQTTMLVDVPPPKKKPEAKL